MSDPNFREVKSVSDDGGMIVDFDGKDVAVSSNYVNYPDQVDLLELEPIDTSRD